MWKNSDNSVLHNFTRSLASGITLTWIAARTLLTNLYLVNRERSDLPLLYEGDYPYVYPQAHGVYLDRLGFMFDVPRIPGEDDEAYRIRILFSLRKNSTKAGIRESIEVLFGAAGMQVRVEIEESYSHALDGTTTTFDAPLRSPKGSLLFGVVIYIIPITVRMRNVEVPGEGLVDLGGSVFNRVSNNYYRYILDVFQETSFTRLINSSIASGIQVDRVVMVEPGSGGSRYRH